MGMQKIKLLLVLVILLPGLILPNSAAVAAGGLPGSVEFGYGARLDARGGNPEGALQMAHSLGLEWIALDFNWQQDWVDPNGQPDTSVLSRQATLASQRGLSVLLSITNAPGWAMNQLGPDPDTTARLVETLVSVSPASILAVELFPGANTIKGWGAAPNPRGYLIVLQAVGERLRQRSYQAVVIASLESRSATPEGDMDDLDFLKALYGAGVPPIFPIVGLRYPELTGAPAQDPAQEDHQLLRHYELVRHLMLEVGHDEGLIWITGLSWPGNVQSGREQALWIGQAYDLLKRQPFVGAAIFTWLNPPGEVGAQDSPYSLVGSDLTASAAAEAIRQVASDTYIQPDNLTNSNSKVNDSITAELQSPDSQTGPSNVLVKKFLGKDWLRKGG